ncbi:MAG: hypothetical protein RLY35_1524 [Bacteroidota bacterium]|jgi:uncharacterized protein (TIGR02145 family)
MQKNLNVSKYRNGDLISTGLDNIQWNITEQGSYAIYGNDIQMEQLYGKLYNWFVVSDMRGVCPLGWKVPDENDWNKLVTSLDPIADTLCITCDQSSIAGAMIKTNQSGSWINGSIGNNGSGFTSLPAGSRNYYGLFSVEGEDGYWWSQDQDSTNKAWFRAQYFSSNIFERRSEFKQHGFSIRCLKE